MPPRAKERCCLAPLAPLLRLLWFLAAPPHGSAEPFSTHQRSCVAGQMCAVTELTGTGLSDGDRVMLALDCGAGPKIPGMPGALGETLPAIGGGTSFSWPSHILPDGGEYAICWCSFATECTTFVKYDVEAGSMTVTGPLAGLQASCTSGRGCLIDGLQGTLLRDGDTVMVLDQCGGSPVDGFPNGAKTAEGASGGTEHGWGGAAISATGGSYALCWCAQGAVCIGAPHYRKQVGTLTVVGPSGGFSAVCSVFQPCSWAGLTGVGLQEGDKIMPLEACGTGTPVAGFPGGGVAGASLGGAAYALGSAGEVVTAGGATYAMCWCGAGGACAATGDFLTLAGTLTLQGPRRDHRVSCIQGGECRVPDFQGVGLADSDRLSIMLVCGVGQPAAGFPDGGTLVPSGGGADYSSWTAPVSAQPGVYRLCWCGLGWDCGQQSNFRMDAGELRVVSLAAGQDRSCHVQDGCQVEGITGNQLRNGDHMRVLTACGAGGAEVPGWPNQGTSEPATASGGTFSWGLVSRVQAAPGSYKMCWCPADHFSGCGDLADFSVEAGNLQLRGPVRLATNGTCVAYQHPFCPVGPFQQGAGLAEGDQVLLLRPEHTCGADPRDPWVGGSGPGQAVGSGMLVEWQPAHLPRGGTWKICYCASYDSLLDAETQPCRSHEDFPAEAGILFVRGAYLGQTINCTRNQVCTFSIRGHDLNKDTNMIALRGESASCGSASPIALSGEPFAASGRVSDEEITFTVSGIQELAAFHLCFCIPVPGAGLCGRGDLRDFHQEVGLLDIRGAHPDQRWQCGTGGQCGLEVTGRHLSPQDRIKIVNSSLECDARAQEEGFFRSLVPAEPPPATTLSAAAFSLGRVTARGAWKVCYCAALGGCDAMDEYTHLAGELLVLDPLNSITLAGATSASVSVVVSSNVGGSQSTVRCAASIYEPLAMPNAADISQGLVLVGLGTGESVLPSVVGDNPVEIFLEAFIRSRQQYRIWCVETSAQSFILPGHPGGTIVRAADGILAPRLRVFPSYLWHPAEFYVELVQVYDSAMDASRTTTAVRVGTAASPQMCNLLSYGEAFSVHVADPGQPGESDVVMLSDQALKASRYHPYVCFFAGPNATGIAIEADRLSVQTTAPAFYQKRIDNQVTRYFYRGALMQVIFSSSAPTDGLLHWTPAAAHAADGCSGASRAPPDAQVVFGANTSFFRLAAPAGTYVMCYLGDRADSTTTAPFNSIGQFELVESIAAIRQHPDLPSTRNTLRLMLEVRVPGTVACIARGGPADVRPQDFTGGPAFQGSASLLVEPAPPGVDPEFPRSFDLTMPLVHYQKTAGPLRVWCRHSAAEHLVFPEGNQGVAIPLQAEEPTVEPVPAFVWEGASLRLRLAGTPAIGSKAATLHEPPLPADWQRMVVTQDGVRKLRYVSNSASVSDEHPMYTLWRQGQGPSPCDGANSSQARSLSLESFTETEGWFVARAASPFVCYWALPGSFPHLVGVLDILAQPPEYQLEVEGQSRSFVYRGVGVHIRLRHTSATGGRVLVVRRADFEAFGFACQAMGLRRRLLGPGTAAAGAGGTLPQPRLLQDEGDDTAAQCVHAPRVTSELGLVPAEQLFPAARWGAAVAEGLNCSQDFRLYHNPLLANTSVLADAARGRYYLVTSNEAVLLHLVPHVGLLGDHGTVPNTSVAVVHRDFTTLSNYSGQEWAVSARDCGAQALLGLGSPMYEEGAEDLPLSQYLAAALPLEGLDFAALAFLPGMAGTSRQAEVCAALQPPAPPPPRGETVFDIDQPGLGRIVRDGLVWVPSEVNGSMTFLHNDPLGEYVLCYAGDEQDEAPVFNPLGAPFASRDVLGGLAESEQNRSDSVRSYVRVASELRGLVRCLALLRNALPPKHPDQVFHPDASAQDFLGVSELVQFDVPGTARVVALDLDQQKARLIAPVLSFVGAPPTMFIWCAHRSSTVLYPSDARGFQLGIQARQPPAFEYRQLNRTVTSVHLTLNLQFTPIVVVWKDPDFPVNQHDEVRFTTRPAMPGGLEVDRRTGAISGMPSELVDSEVRSVVAASAHPPYANSAVDLVIRVDDVLGLRFTYANAERVTLTIRPRSSSVFQALQVFVLTRPQMQRFTRRPEEFFCIDALQGQAYSNASTVKCSVEGGLCCCAGFILQHLPVQDLRIDTQVCSFEPQAKYHAAGMVHGSLATAEGTRVAARLASTYQADFIVPAEVPPEEKSPVVFDLVVLTPWALYRLDTEGNDAALVREISAAVGIPPKLVEISRAESGKGGVVFEVSFFVEARCLEQVGAEVEIMSLGINTKEGCNLISPAEYMQELKTQLSDGEAALFYREDLELLRLVSVAHSFSYARTMHFCNREPFWEFGAVVSEPEECPFDLVKLGAVSLIGGTVGILLVFSVLSYVAHECAACSFLSKARPLDLLTPILALYTALADYVWLVMLRANAVHPMHGVLFLGGLVHLLVCFCVSAVALRVTISTHILDTPWWRRNRRRLRPVLLLSAVAPRFFRLTRSNLFGLDVTHIHFGTPSKMAIVFSNLGMAMLLQDIPQLIMQLYIWLIWRNAAPKISFVCFALGVQSIATAVLHHVFSRSQRAAYERVVKLLGVRRLTAGFFDVTSLGQGGELQNMRRADDDAAQLGLEDEAEGNLDEALDPAKLDPIQAAVYIAQLYERETRALAVAGEAEASSSSAESGGDGEAEGSGSGGEGSAAEGRELELGEEEGEAGEDASVLPSAR